MLLQQRSRHPLGHPFRLAAQKGGSLAAGAVATFLRCLRAPPSKCPTDQARPLPVHSWVSDIQSGAVQFQNLRVITRPASDLTDLHIQEHFQHRYNLCIVHLGERYRWRFIRPRNCSHRRMNFPRSFRCHRHLSGLDQSV